MPYQSFTDVLDELEERLQAALLSSSPEAPVERSKNQGGLAVVQRVREELTAIHVEPTAIYRAVAAAQIAALHSLQTVPEKGRGAFGLGAADAAHKLLQKAQVMQRRRG